MFSQVIHAEGIQEISASWRTPPNSVKLTRQAAQRMMDRMDAERSMWVTRNLGLCRDGLWRLCIKSTDLNCPPCFLKGTPVCRDLSCFAKRYHCPALCSCYVVSPCLIWPGQRKMQDITGVPNDTVALVARTWLHTPCWSHA